MEEARKFLTALRSDPRAAELLGEKPRPASEAEELEIYAQVAGELGYSLTAQQIADAAEAMAREQLAQTAQAEELVAQDLDPEELEKVAGGYVNPNVINYRDPEDYLQCDQPSYDFALIYRKQRGCTNVHRASCGDSYEDGEWCWITDSCSKLLSVY